MVAHWSSGGRVRDSIGVKVADLGQVNSTIVPPLEAHAEFTRVNASFASRMRILYASPLVACGQTNRSILSDPPDAFVLLVGWSLHCVTGPQNILEL